MPCKLSSQVRTCLFICDSLLSPINKSKRGNYLRRKTSLGAQVPRVRCRLAAQGCLSRCPEGSARKSDGAACSSPGQALQDSFQLTTAEMGAAHLGLACRTCFSGPSRNEVQKESNQPGLLWFHGWLPGVLDRGNYSMSQPELLNPLLSRTPETHQALTHFS